MLTERPAADLAAWLMRERVPHLAVSAAGAIGLVVGLLALPGLGIAAAVGLVVLDLAIGIALVVVTGAIS